MSLWLVTFYCACFLCTGKHPGDPAHGVTSSGAPVRREWTVACPPGLDGHLVSIAGVGLRMCEDRGGAIVGRRLDVYVPTHAEALRLGVARRVVLVYPRGCV